MYNALKIEIVPIVNITLDILDPGHCTSSTLKKDNKYNNFRNFLLLRTNSKNKKQPFKVKP